MQRALLLTVILWLPACMAIDDFDELSFGDGGTFTLPDGRVIDPDEFDSDSGVDEIPDSDARIGDPDPPHEALCDDLVDNDGDGRADCADPDCEDEPSCVQSKERDCADGIDNDGDGLVDCIDPDCESTPSCLQRDVETDCTDGLDGDADGARDCADDDCAGTPSCSSSSTGEQCGDGIDNDGDDKVDCDDPDCLPGISGGGHADAGVIDAGLSEPACRLVPPQCGCSPDEACKLDSTGVRFCDEPGSLDVWAQCFGEGRCPAGTLCAGPSNGPSQCKPLCRSDEDCEGASVCNDLTDDPVAGVCSPVCDPVSQTGDCPPESACTLGARVQSPDEGVTRCITPGIGEEGACCDDNTDCAPGFACPPSLGQCLRWCRPESGCPSGAPCMVVTMVGDTRYGLCPPPAPADCP